MWTARFPPFFDPHHAGLEADARAFRATGTMRERVAALGAAGLLRRGTARGDVRGTALIRHGLAYEDGLTDLAFIIQELGGWPLSRAPGFEAEVEDVRAGRSIVAFALTEPGAGSDVRALSTTAVRHGDTYRLTGIKCFISNAPDAHAAVVFARHDDGIGCFFVENPPVSPQRVAGHSVGRLELADTPARLVSRRGLPLALGALERCRPTVGAAALGLARRAFDETVRHVSTREQFGAPLAVLPVVRQRIAEMALDLETATLAVLHGCWRRDTAPAAARTAYESAVAKVTATEAAGRVVDRAVQLHGALGVEEDSLVQRIWRELRPLRIYEGATDVLSIVIADHWLRPENR